MKRFDIRPLARQRLAAIADCVSARRAHGHLTYDGDAVVGWCNAAPLSLLDAACNGLKTQTLRRVRAAPSRKAEGEAQNYHGPLEMYLDAGFSIEREEPDGRVHVYKDLV